MVQTAGSMVPGLCGLTDGHRLLLIVGQPYGVCDPLQCTHDMKGNVCHMDNAAAG